MNTPALTPYRIEQRLLELAALHEDAVTDGDSESQEAIEADLGRYLTEQAVRDPRANALQVNSLSLLIKRELKDADDVESQAKELMLRAKRRREFAQRMKDMILATLQRFGITRLETPEITLRVQRNGGVEPLQLDPECVPHGYCRVTMTIPAPAFDLMRRTCIGVPQLDRYFGEAQEEPASDVIREALKQRVACPECKGHVGVPGDATCPRCHGEGTIPNTVPGAKLWPRGEHLRIS